MGKDVFIGDSALYISESALYISETALYISETAIHIRDFPKNCALSISETFYISETFQKIVRTSEAEEDGGHWPALVYGRRGGAPMVT